MKYTPHTNSDVKAMLKTIGVSSIDELYADVPETLKLKTLGISAGISQPEAEKELNLLADKNHNYSVILRGAGAYDHYIPPVVRAMSARSEFVTAYTPYQAELSQGILQSIFEYQTMICNLTGMDVSNASHYDGATAAAEAVLMTKERGRNKVLIAPSVRPDTLKVFKTYLLAQGFELQSAPEKDGLIDFDALSIDETYATVYVEQPAYNGLLNDCVKLGQIAHNAGAKFIMSVNPSSLGLLKKPSECGADIAVGEGQSLGLPLNFGGPYLGFMATNKTLLRKLPGRIVGETLDHNGNKAYVLTLQAREQHIRREKAGSNICSNEAHCALTAAMYLSTLGEKGLKEVAQSSVNNAHKLAKLLINAGLKLKYECEFFNEFVTVSPVSSDIILSALKKKGILGGLKLNDNEILWCATETVSSKDLSKAASIVRRIVKC